MTIKITPKTNRQVHPGQPEPLGATWEGNGTNFAIYSEYAQCVYVCLFDRKGQAPTDIIPLTRSDHAVWHIRVEGIHPGQMYGYKVEGPYDPVNGQRFNAHKLLLDPYAKAVFGQYDNSENHLQGYAMDHKEQDLSFSLLESFAHVPKSLVIDNHFDWQDDKPLNISLNDLILYEIHLKGFTAHPSSMVKHPGTYLGLIEKIPYLKKLGVNAVEVLPVQHFFVRDGLVSAGLSEYWGYNTVSFLAPEPSYGSKREPGVEVVEFKTMVRELHKAGIEVIMDVVYNHTAEGNELGPTICYRGVDNATYYSLVGVDGQPYRHYLNDTGCGNTFNIEHPLVMRLVMDSLRYWVEVMHVDGFRFDLASILARVKGRYDKDSLFFKLIQDDPVLNQRKLIAEPWDLTTYQVGHFPYNWSEWNGRFRDTIRRFNKGDPRQIQDLAWRLTGSADLYGQDQRQPHNSINFITCHDGFTLSDLYAYNQKHNEANKEDNRDGSNDNHSWNCGCEGPTDEDSVNRLRKKMAKNALCFLFFSIGTPMLLAGDECMRTQQGNNNAYCQDNELTWFDWGLIDRHDDLFHFSQKAIAFRQHYSILKREKFLSGKDQDHDNVPDVLWFDAHLNTPDWLNPDLKCLCYQFDGSEIPSDLGDYHLFFILNADEKEQTIELPQYDGKQWYRAIDTDLPAGEEFCQIEAEVLLSPPERYLAKPYSVVVLIGKMSS
ncbi:MAG: glycogen debranching protein GlgX [Candidatus Omnitrophica bacterium]|nr:glycogen debranching protein GlgX [Candidatus Omnitrophota bacterium]